MWATTPQRIMSLAEANAVVVDEWGWTELRTLP